MIVAIIVFLSLIHIMLGSHIHVLGGDELFLPLMMLLLAALGQWSYWFLALGALALVGLFSPISWWIIFLLPIFSALMYYIFRRWITTENIFAESAIASLVALAFFAIVYTIITRNVSVSSVGSLILGLPLIIGWFWWQNRNRGN